MISKIKDLIRESFIVKSLKFRIILLLLLTGIIPVIITRGIILRYYEKNAVSSRNSDLSIQCNILSNYLLSSGYLDGNMSDEVNAEIEQMANLYDGRVIIIDRDFRAVKDTYGIYESKIIISEDVLKAFSSGESSSGYDAPNHYVEVVTPVLDTNTGEGCGVIIACASTDSLMATIDALRRNALLLEVIITIIIIAISIICSRLLMRPFDRVTQAINKIEAGYEQEVIDVKGYTEMESIVGALNQLLSRMKKLDDSRQEFVSNVSHELKTPLASMKVLADSLITMGDGATSEMYREFMEDITHEIDRENSIITDLLSLVKMDKTAGTLNIKEVDINEMTEAILKRLKPLADQSGIELIFESVRPVKAEVDEVKLTLAVSNLIENAIKYNNPNGWVRVMLDADHQFFLITVTDSGIGIPAEAQDHVFERFYRVDKSHSREIGGTGLGLAIARSAVIMHRGAIKVSSLEGQGTEFALRIPLTYITPATK
ncbi:MAG: two-component sensor histidine kinase [Lachnospiraceae bacterium]|nr:two-component sensor histidine kinase [Lachnospiraceae bacterium]MBR4175148.1 two-component sensor histidine kinase [Lachnospiraceae bacterium]